MNEERLVAWLAASAGRTSAIGDDTATLPRPRGAPVVTVDQQIEGVHFPAGLDPVIVARRLLAVNLSDLAASGAIPRHAFLALAAPAEFPHRRLFTALLAAAERHRVALAGGDLARSPTLHLSLTLIGEKLPGEAPLGRDRARAGDAIWVGGTLGESANGQRLVARGARLHRSAVVLPPSLRLRGELRTAARRAVRRHLEPTPQLELGRWLARLGPGRAGAAIDLSDGFAKDLHRICATSGTGARIDAAALDACAPPGFAELCGSLNEEPTALIRGGGEDYVLLFTLRGRLEPPERFGCRRVGIVTRERAVRTIDGRGRARRLAARGWDHLAAPPATIRR